MAPGFVLLPVVLGLGPGVRDPGVRPERACQERGRTRADRRAGRQRPSGAPRGGTRAGRPGGGRRSAAGGDDARSDRGARRRGRGGRPGGRCGRPGHCRPDASRRGPYGGRGSPAPGGRDCPATHGALAQPRQSVDRRRGGAPVRRGCLGSGRSGARGDARDFEAASRESGARGGAGGLRRQCGSAAAQSPSQPAPGRGGRSLPRGAGRRDASSPDDRSGYCPAGRRQRDCRGSTPEPSSRSAGFSTLPDLPARRRDPAPGRLGNTRATSRPPES